MTVVTPKARHGRIEERRLWVLADPALNGYAGSAGTVGTGWPHLAQVCRLARRRVDHGTGEVKEDVAYAVTSLTPAEAGPGRLLALWRGHWGIENRLHWRRDVVFDEDRCQIRSGAAPQAVAACRNLVLTLLRRTGVTNVAAALRTYAARPSLAIRLVATNSV